ncbi:MAG: glycosyl hydrolase family 18 protein [Clostridia bacterium]|nr:glycosyl hydrolase family 18 protein [Clostridia bacterium]
MISKKILKIYMMICIVVISFLYFLTLGFAAENSKTIHVTSNKVYLLVNGKVVKGNNFLYNGTTYVPIRTISEMLGKEVSWNRSTNTASINDHNTGAVVVTRALRSFQGIREKYIQVDLNRIHIIVNGSRVNKENILYQGTTYVPIRQVSEMLGKEVLWDLETSTANIKEKGAPAVTPLPLPPYNVIAYLSGWTSWSANDIEAEQLTHINYAFANVKNGLVVSEITKDLENFAKLRAIKKQFPHLKTLISVGGWSWSKGFHHAALTEASRKKLAESAVKFMKTHGFDGIDLDWEYPGQIGNGNPYGPEDKHNFTLLIKELKVQLDLAGKTDGKHYLLTIAANANQNYVDHTELQKIHGDLDFIHLMTYDFFGEWESKTGHLANLYASQSNLKGPSAHKGVELFKKLGVPANKMIIGVAFYGRYFNKVENVNHGLNQKFSGGGAMDYDKVALNIGRNGYKKYFDTAAKAPYLWNGSRFISYEDQESIANKAAYVKKNGLGGAMFWEYTQDKSGTLLSALYKDLR